MSHIVQVQTEVRDPIAIQAACGRLSLANAVHQETKLFSSSVIGWAVQLPDWRYPIVCDVTTATIAFDNFGGHWGEQRHLDRFLQGYAIEKSTRPQCPP
jgi:hypothetical protein